jgi:hypothetical protein
VLRRGSDRRKAPRKSNDSRPGEASNQKTRQESRTDPRRNGNGRKKPASADAPLETSETVGSEAGFVLYFEGARDREILACWARRVDHGLARAIEAHSVILGGRRPARAISDFRKRGGFDAGLKGLIVLDRDDHRDSHGDDHGDGKPSIHSESGNRPSLSEEAGLDVFVWSRRHIESYLLVPAALRRLVGLAPDDRRIERFVDEEEHGPEALHAKRLLGTGGSLTEVLGAELRAGEIARAMRRDEFHPDIFDLFGRIGHALGLSQSGPEVVVRVRSRS